ncbi:hypothetical protein GCM10028818_24780 [Spirosoma horti]
MQIKQAGGMQRGKTDKVDAQRIAQYAYCFRDQMRLWPGRRSGAATRGYAKVNLSERYP